MQSSDHVPAPEEGQRITTLNLLPQELLLDVMEYLAIEPDVTSSDQTVQRRRNLSKLCLVSRRLAPRVRPALYEIVHISTETRLWGFVYTLYFQRDIGKLVRKLFLNIELCGETASRPNNQILCAAMFCILNWTTKLQLLSLDLKECNCCFRNSGPEDFAANGTANGKPRPMNCISPTDKTIDGYNTFYKLVTERIWDESNVAAEYRTFLPKVRELHFTSTETPYNHCAFFALPSLRRIESVRDTGDWSLILHPSHNIGIHNPYIRELVLRSSALVPSEAYIIAQSFPNLEILEARTNHQEANRRFGLNETIETNFDEQNLSTALANLPRLRRLDLQLDYPRTRGMTQINFPMHLGPTGGITSLQGLSNLTDLTIGIHHLMRYCGDNSQPRADPLSPTVLPRRLERLQLYTCLSCWDNWIARLSRNPWEPTFPSFSGVSTLDFVCTLAEHVGNGIKLRNLRDVRIFSRKAWWQAYGVDYRAVVHCKEDEGQVWNAGGFEECSGISRLERAGVHFRAFETVEFDCGRDNLP